MKTNEANYYIFFSVKDFWKKVNYWKSKGRVWINNDDPKYKPKATQKEMPCVLNVDNWSMMWAQVNADRRGFFEDPTFVELYNKTLREIKLKRILK